MTAVVESGNLIRGLRWELYLSATAALGDAEGIHYILLVPSKGSGPGDNFYRREELERDERKELLILADEIGERKSKELLRPGYYRLMVNGSTAATRDHFHIHIVVGRQGATFRKCTDSIIA